MTDIITLGEVLIDLTQTEIDENGIKRFAAFPGGAPANVAVAASRLGAKAGFIGKVGKDAFGAQLRAVLEEDDVDTSCLFETGEVPTTLAIVSVDESGERSFSFYRNPGADTQLTEEEATQFPGGAADALPQILHFGSLSLTNQPSRGASLAAAAQARAKGVLISYDPNYRSALWPDEAEAVRWMKTPLELADILKISDEELVLLSGSDDLEAGSKALAEYGVRLILITLGSEGVFYRLRGAAAEADACGTVAEADGGAPSETVQADACGIVPGVPVSVCDTNGAGDTFLGAVLAQLAGRGANGPDGPGSLCDSADCLSGLTEEELRGILAFANRAAAKTCSRAGAIPAMPTLKELGE